MKTNPSESKELWQTTHNWLNAVGNSVNKIFCKEQVSAHPDYPAITSVVDFLDNGGMSYQAVQADASYIHEFNYPLLAHIKQPRQEYMHIISDATEWDKQKDITNLWSGVVIYPEKNASWYHKENESRKKQDSRNKLIAFGWLVAGLVLFIFAALNISVVTVNTFGFLALSGLVLSIFVLGVELGFQNEIVKQVCGAVSDGGCEKVLKSTYAKGFAGFTPADISVLYFTTQFIMYIAGSFYPPVLPLLFFISLPGIIVACWSIYTQAFQLKKYCTLCLVIVAVLIIQAAIGIFSIPEIVFEIAPVSLIAAVFFISGIILFPIKQLLKTNETNRHKLAELTKWKTDSNLFITQWQQEQQVDTTIWKNDLVIGEPSAPIIITVACNPYCGPCAKAHLQLDDLLQRFNGKLAVQVRLLCNPDKEEDKRTIAVKALLQNAAITKNKQDMQEMLTDWFAWMDFEKWNSKWLQLNDSQKTAESQLFAEEIERALRKHSNWIDESNISSTPTFFINGRRLPGRYSLNDMEQLIPRLSELLTKELVK